MKKVVIIYFSGTGNTKKMAQAIAEGAKSVGDIETKIAYVESASKELIENAEYIALGCPSMGDEVLDDTMEDFVESLSGLDWGTKKLALFGSYDWGDCSWMRDWENRMVAYGASLVSEGLCVHLTPDEESLACCKALGRKIVK